MRTWLVGLAIVHGMAAVSLAQEPQNELNVVASPGELSESQEQRAYERELERRADPRVAIRARAEQRAQERRNRLAALRWYGLSASRPITNVTPMTSGYSPAWANGAMPWGWNASRPIVVLHTDRIDSRR